MPLSRTPSDLRACRLPGRVCVVRSVGGVIAGSYVAEHRDGEPPGHRTAGSGPPAQRADLAVSRGYQPTRSSNLRAFVTLGIRTVPDHQHVAAFTRSAARSDTVETLTSRNAAGVSADPLGRQRDRYCSAGAGAVRGRGDACGAVDSATGHTTIRGSVGAPAGTRAGGRPRPGVGGVPLYAGSRAIAAAIGFLADLLSSTFYWANRRLCADDRWAGRNSPGRPGTAPRPSTLKCLPAGQLESTVSDEAPGPLPG